MMRTHLLCLTLLLFGGFALAQEREPLDVAREGMLRDLDALAPELVIGTIRARIESELGGDLARGRDAAIEAVRSERYLALVDRIVDAAWDPLTTGLADAPAGTALAECVGSTWRKFARAAAVLRRDSATDDDWHEARIVAKQMRYAGEAVTPMFGKPAKALARQAEDVQEVLGEHQDAVIAAAVLRRLAASGRPNAGAFTLGLLYARQQDAIAASREQFAGVWAQASKPRHRKWLRG